MFSNQFGDFIDLDLDPSNFVDPDTINPDPQYWRDICYRRDPELEQTSDLVHVVPGRGFQQHHGRGEEQLERGNIS